MTTTDEWEYIFVRFITLRNGQRLYAASKGLKAFRIRVRRKPSASANL